jgi:cyclophilin family peptidyl-prolyl cis-trans isomerase
MSDCWPVLQRGGASCRPRFLRRWAALALLACSGALLWAGSAEANPFVRLDYSIPLQNRLRNTVFLELFDDKNLTRDNFLLYVNGGKYDNSLVHRLATNFVLQAGGYFAEFLNEPAPVNVSLNPDAQIDLDGNPATANPTVVNEYSKGTIRSNQAGTIAMARRGGQPDSADSEWFVNFGNNAFLDTVDGGFTVFGRVAGDGMSLLNAYNGGLSIVNLNPDRDNNGVRDSAPNQLNPFGGSATDGVPVINSLTGVLEIEDAQQVDYYATSLPLNVPLGGLTISTRDAYIDTGATFTGTGTTVTIGAGRTLGIREGITLNRNLVNQGTLEIGMQLGAPTVQAFQQSASGKLEIQIDGPLFDTEYDRLQVTGFATLAGSLTVEVGAGYTPKASDVFTILTSTNLAGTFANAPQNSRLFTTSGEGSFVVSYDSALDKVMLASFAFAADFNRDGSVNAADLTTWRTSMSLGNGGADADNDGDSDGNDFLIWQRQLGRTTPAITSVAAGVPEPGTAALAAFALVAVCRRSRRD